LECGGPAATFAIAQQQFEAVLLRLIYFPAMSAANEHYKHEAKKPPSHFAEAPRIFFTIHNTGS
jgi:hypothetical protein